MQSSLIRRMAMTVITFAVAAFPVSAQVELPDPVYQVSMSASYEPETQLVQGSERIRWKNTSSVPVDELQFHLYLNAFANDRSTFMAESGGQLRDVEISKDGWSWIEVESMRLAYGADLVAAGLISVKGDADPFDGPLAPAVPGEPEPVQLSDRPDLKLVEEFIRPDDGNQEDRTVARYPLPKPIQPGEWVELEIDFDAQMPKIFARTGAHGDFVLGGQWFPKIGVFEDAGDRGRPEAGWNTHQFHANSEFFADFGDWDVRLELPARYAGGIGATGRLLEETVDGDTVTAHFAQRGVHDFAWTASPDFIVVEDHFDPDTDVRPEETQRMAELLGVSPEELRLQAVDITLLLQPAHRSQADRYIKAAKAAIAGYGLPLGAYPWDTLTMVDPPRGGMGAGGMEYPTFITLGTHPVLGLPGFDKVLAPEVGDGARVRPQLLPGDDCLQRVRGGVDRRGNQLILRVGGHGRVLPVYDPALRDEGHPIRFEPAPARLGPLHRLHRATGLVLSLERQLRPQQLRPPGGDPAPSGKSHGRAELRPGHAALFPDLAFSPPIDRGFRDDHPRRGGHRPRVVSRSSLPHRPWPRLPDPHRKVGQGQRSHWLVLGGGRPEDLARRRRPPRNRRGDRGRGRCRRR